MANLKTGSSGGDVKKMQEALIKAGYDVGNTKADGVFGPKTTAAVKQYQKDHGLAVDGIADKNTLGSLYGGGGTASNTLNAAGGNKKPGLPPVAVNIDQTEGGSAKAPEEEKPAETPPTAEPPAFSYDPYAQSDIVQQANALLQQQDAAKPGAYQSQWQAQINEYLNKIMNRDPFSYNFNDDALYHQYKDIYTQMGLMSMMDTMGQAAAMTGGYGNSYAQTVGQQAYNQQLSQLNNVLPELYQMAFDRYAYEGDQLHQQYGMLMDQENMDYGRYMDSYNMWADQRDYLAGRYDTLSREDYTKWQDDTDRKWQEYVHNNNVEYQQGRDAIGDQKDYYDRLAGLIGDTGYSPTADELKAAGMSQAEANALKNAYTASLNKDSGGGGGGGGGDDKATKYTEFTYEEQTKWDKEFQRADSLYAAERVADRMAQAGIDPQFVAQWFDYYAEKFKDKEPEPTPKKTGGGGGGGGTMYIDLR